MLTLKAFHLIFMVTWFAGLFYLPRLFVYHAMNKNQETSDTFKIMERKLFWGITTPGGILTILTGLGLITYNPGYYLSSPWMWIKLFCVFMLIIFHIFCGYYYEQFKKDSNTHSHKFYRYFNEIPTVFLFVIIFMVTLKPVFS